MEFKLDDLERRVAVMTVYLSDKELKHLKKRAAELEISCSEYGRYKAFRGKVPADERECAALGALIAIKQNVIDFGRKFKAAYPMRAVQGYSKEKAEELERILRDGRKIEARLAEISGRKRR